MAIPLWYQNAPPVRAVLSLAAVLALGWPDLEGEALRHGAADVQVRDVGLGHDLLDRRRVVVAGLDERDVPVGPCAGVVERVEEAEPAAQVRRVLARGLVARAPAEAHEHRPRLPPRRVPGHRPWAVADQGDAVALARGAQAAAQRLPALGGPELPRVPEFVRALAPHGVQPLRVD